MIGANLGKNNASGLDTRAKRLLYNEGTFLGMGCTADCTGPQDYRTTGLLLIHMLEHSLDSFFSNY